MKVLDDPTPRPGRPDVEAPLIVWEYAFALERRCDALVAERDRAVKALKEVLDTAQPYANHNAYASIVRIARAALVEDSDRG